MVRAQATGWFILQRTNNARLNARKLGLISVHGLTNDRNKLSPLKHSTYRVYNATNCMPSDDQNWGHFDLIGSRSPADTCPMASAAQQAFQSHRLLSIPNYLTFMCKILSVSGKL